MITAPPPVKQLEPGDLDGEPCDRCPPAKEAGNLVFNVRAKVAVLLKSGAILRFCLHCYTDRQAALDDVAVDVMKAAIT